MTIEQQINVHFVMQNKPKPNWIVDDMKNVQYDLKARNMLISALGVNEYYLDPYCNTSKAIWDALETLHEGTEDVKQSKSIFSSNNMNYSHGGW
ncbi:hypothetical protein MTR_3g026340 [Medicago truncatula]|uniref:Uncharacterized protein n=1 Tax=Medicago truncatula TaxID=3880 RepID=A0A072UTJ8_MEDTR|nr:hypothetical protein MTR_3g026340 [Medicago truncatula]